MSSVVLHFHIFKGILQLKNYVIEKTITMPQDANKFIIQFLTFLYESFNSKWVML
ncbi:hypothetical protein SAMN05428988_2532 [Chitinophaga sp. YR573]|nr:hypothetical protein SAMN05428988_2532 [Chitinophaga sp. YR573]